MDIERFLPLINTLILILIFFYNKVKNKVLVDKIKEQSNLLKETKDVVTQQAQAIESQKKVVDTAVLYSNNFDLKKIENIVKRELSLDYEEKLKKKENEIKLNNAKFKIIIDELANDTAKNLIAPIIISLIVLLSEKNKEERERLLAEIPDHGKEIINNGLKQFENAKNKALCAALSGMGMAP